MRAYQDGPSALRAQENAMNNILQGLVSTGGDLAAAYPANRQAGLAPEALSLLFQWMAP